ncbi:invasion associated locus B family protein [Oceaniglobus indicus]|uniref:invasion associated locus B family protein n=1 Tax=Oceaniglobus indicus TaxID=2047749 RepID=UPI000C178B0E|nr:invasion associated locus B family protein [Oceaniglobus indicus]
MPDLLKTLSIVALIAAGGMAAAQTDPATSDTTTPDTTTPDTATSDEPATTAEGETDTADVPDNLNMGTDVTEGVGSSYIKEEFNDWQVRCVRAQEGKDRCEMYQLLEDSDGNPTAEVSIFTLPAGQKAAAGASLITPLETLLTVPLTLAVDGGATKTYPYTFCTQIGCISQVGFTAGEIATFKAGAKATLSLVPVRAPDQKVELVISLAGFTAAYESVSEN